MRLLLISQYTYPDSSPSGMYVFQLALELKKHQHDITILCSNAAYNGKAKYPSREVISQVRIRRLSTYSNNRNKLVSKLFSNVSFYISILSWLLRPNDDFDVIICISTPPFLGLFCRYISWIRKERLIHWIMDLYPDVLIAHFGKKRVFSMLAHLARRSYENSRAIITLGDFMAMRCKKYIVNSKRLHAVPLWCNRDDSGSTFPVVEISNMSDLKLMYSGNMGKGHLFDDFLSAAEKLGNSGPWWIFSGGGPRKIEIIRFMKCFPIAKIRVSDYVAESNLVEHLMTSHVQLVSLREEWQGCMVPSKIHQICELGLPVIFVGGRDNEIARWITEFDAGWVVNPGDVGTLIANIQSAAVPTIRMHKSQNAKRLAQCKFSRRENLSNMIRIIEHSLGPRD